jgi:hypothetical protein
MSDDWSAMVAFRGGHATDVNPGTSSVANSNILGNVWVNPNSDIAATSNYSVAERVIASFTWQHHFFGDYLTQFSMFGDMHSGAPYSWVSGTDTNGDGYSRDLVYIPKSITDVEWASAVTDAQKAQFMSYVDGNSYLKKHEGEIAQRNAVRAPWINQFDFAFRQEIPGIFEGNKGELRFDFFNIGNLFNNHWGVEQRAGFPLIRNLANVSGYNPVTGKYIYDISSSAYKDKNGKLHPAESGDQRRPDPGRADSEPALVGHDHGQVQVLRKCLRRSVMIAQHGCGRIRSHFAREQNTGRPQGRLFFLPARTYNPFALSVGPQGRSRRVASTSLAARATLSVNGFQLDSPLFYFACTSARYRLILPSLEIDFQRLPAMQAASPKMPKSTVSARISPVAGMDVLSRDEVSRLRDASLGGLHGLLRRCSLAVLTSGSMSDDPRSMAERYPDFDVAGAAAGSRRQARTDQRAS